MPALAVVLVLLATMANATALVLQRKAARDTGGHLSGSVRDQMRRPAWIAGIAILVGALGLQVTALSLGSIALVQPVLVMELPFTLLLGWLVLGGTMRRYEWAAVATMSVGLVVLLASLRPEGGDALGASDGVWTVGAAVTLATLVALGAVARRSRSTVAAALHGVAAGAGSGFVAVIVKAMTEALARGGLVEVLTTPQSYLLVPTAPIAFLALQRCLRAGRLVASQPGFVLCNPLLASFWGVALLGEQVKGGLALVGGTLGAVLLTAGVFLLVRSPVLADRETDDTAAIDGATAA